MRRYNNYGEAWTIDFMLRLYCSKSINRFKLRYNTLIEKYRLRIISERNMRLFEVLLGERDVGSLTKAEIERFNGFISRITSSKDNRRHIKNTD